MRELFLYRLVIEVNLGDHFSELASCRANVSLNWSVSSLPVHLEASIWLVSRLDDQLR